MVEPILNTTSTSTTATPSKEKHIHLQKRWMVYSKDAVVEKLMENLDTLIKYFTACEEEKKDIVYSDTMNNYIKSRLQNIHNLVSSLTLHDEIPQDQYSHFDHLQGHLEIDFNKPLAEVNLEVRTAMIKDYIDSLLDMEIFDEEDEIDDEDSYDSEDDPEMEDPDDFVLPDNASIIDINNECKKRKQM